MPENDIKVIKQLILDNASLSQEEKERIFSNIDQDIALTRQLVQDHPGISQEEKERILSEIEAGKYYGFNSGYSSIDKPWREHYHMDKYYAINNTMTIYEDLVYNNKDHLNDVAIEYFGSKITYRKLFKQIDKTAKALAASGIKKGDKVTVCCAGIPELIYTVYALAKIGAVANLMAPYFEKEEMAARIKECGSKKLIVMDSFYYDKNYNVKDKVDGSGIESTIIIPTLNSSILRFITKKNKAKLNYCNEMWWNDFIKKGKNQPEPPTLKYEKDYPLCMVYSSGTSGPSKAIVLSHDSFQYSVLSYDAFLFDRTRGQKMYQIIPPWYSTGLNTSIHLALHSGVTVFQDPRFERKPFVNNIIKHHIDYVVAPTSMFEGFVDPSLSKYTDGKKITNLGNPFEGGEPLTADVKHSIENKWETMGCKSKLTSGYGQCECGATVTSPSQYIEHHLGSVAQPLPGIEIVIVDDNFNEVKYGERGHIVILTPCGMLEYFNNPEATNNFFHTDKYGRKWSCTGDVGMLAPNGDLFVYGRDDDFTVVNDEKIYNFDVESPVRQQADIVNCDVIGRPNEDGKRELALHVIFNKKYDEVYKDMDAVVNRFKQFQVEIYEKYGSVDFVPSYFKIRTEFPHKPSGKRDVESLKQETDGFIYINASQTIKEQIPQFQI